MLLRRLVAALGPLLLCVLVCAIFRWLDGMIGAASFLAFLLKGALLGAALAGGWIACDLQQRPDALAAALPTPQPRRLWACFAPLGFERLWSFIIRTYLPLRELIVSAVRRR